ncbi:hypothetical protein GC163_05390 [bacterium]|nr:hypothetical protein [bacterium]
MSHHYSGCCRLLLVTGLCLVASTASAQQTRYTEGRHYIYDQFVPPGVAGQMSVMAGKVRPFHPQQLKVVLPCDGTVTFFAGSPNRPLETAAPAQAAVMVGPMYRIRLSNLADFPQHEFFPSIELIDELHPPPGQAERFPIEVEFLREELEWAANGRMVTKVVYLEQPDRVPVQNLQGTPRVTNVAQGENAVGHADLLGRPIAIVRLGGRQPDLRSPDPQFWGPMAPVTLVQVAPPTAVQPTRFDAPPRQDRRQVTTFPGASADQPSLR